MDHVAVGEHHVVHILPQFGTDTQGMRHLVPKDTIPGNDAPRLTLSFVRFDHNQIIEGAYEATFNGNVPAVANVNAVRVGPVAQQLQVLDVDPVRLADREVPRAGIAQHHSFQGDVLAMHLHEVPGMSCATAPINNPPAPKSDVGSPEHKGGRIRAQPAVAANLEGFLGPNDGPHDRSSGDINSLVVSHDPVADFVDTGAKEKDVRIARLGE